MSNKRDDMLEDYLAGKDGLSDAYGEIDQTTAAARLDRAILDAAHAAVASTPAKTGSWNPFGGGSWFVPTVAVSIFVLALGILFTLNDEMGLEQVEKDLPRAGLSESETMSAERPQLPPAESGAVGYAPEPRRQVARPAPSPRRERSEAAEDKRQVAKKRAAPAAADQADEQVAVASTPATEIATEAPDAPAAADVPAERKAKAARTGAERFLAAHYTQHDSLDALPAAVRSYFLDKLGVPISAVGAPFDATDLIAAPDAPRHRLIKVGTSDGVYFVWYESGGRAYTQTLAVFARDGKTVRLIYLAAPNGRPADLSALRRQVASGALRDDSAEWQDR